MSYNSLEFLLFFAGFMAVYLIMPRVWLRRLVILAGSLFFYYCAGSKSMLTILIATSLVVYLASRCMDRVYRGYDAEKEGMTPKEAAALLAAYKKRSKKYLLGAFVVVLGILIYIKVGRMIGFAMTTSFRDFGFGKVIFPLGISYYTFSSAGYLLDVYWRKTKCEHNYLKLFTCMIFFPHIVQGPISRYDKLLKQLDALPKFSYDRVCFGLQRMLWGLFKKSVVADRIALYTSSVYAAPADFAGVEIFLAVVLGVFELYADFSGCMDIVIGASEVMGITLEENFKEPFFSKSAAEFWRRWHITLGTWFKDYVYMPIAMSPRFMKFSGNFRKKHGNRAGQIISAAIPLTVVWLLTGLWHGTGADYIVWGCYWGALIILGTVLAPNFKKWNAALKLDPSIFSVRLFQMVRTFFLFCIGRMLTVTGSLAGFAVMVKQLFAGHRLWVLFDESIFKHGLDRKDFYVVLFGLALMWTADMLHQKLRIREMLAKQPLLFRWIIYLGAILLLLVFGMYGPAYDTGAFLYGGF